MSRKAPTIGRASAAGSQGKGREDGQKGQEVAGGLKLGRVAWGISASKEQGHPGDGGRQQGGRERRVLTFTTKAGPCWACLSAQWGGKDRWVCQGQGRGTAPSHTSQEHPRGKRP